MIWRIVHAVTFIHWTILLATAVYTVAENGDMPKSANPGGHFETSFVLYLIAVLICTSASGLRACWLETRP